MTREVGTTRRPKALVFIDHDLIIRHFIKSAAFKELEQRHDVTYVFNDDPDVEKNKRWINTDVQSLGLPRTIVTHIPRKRMGSWYRLYAITVLHNQRGTPNYAGRKQRLIETVGRFRVLFMTVLSMPLIFPLVRRYGLYKQGTFKPLEMFVRKEAPDIIIQPSLLTGYYTNELLILSKKLSIPYIVLMNSWDNPSQKAVTTGFPDKLVVWGKQTRDHAVEYLQMPEKDIAMFGAAQFQIYRAPINENGHDLRALFKVPECRRIVLYAGVSKSINETRHLHILEAAIERGKIPNCHILYRPHPWRGGLIDDEQDFFSARFKHISMDPFMSNYYRRVVSKSSSLLEMAECEIMKKILNMVDGTISSLSTVLLETLLHGKPAISFMPTKDMENKYGASATISQKLAHFQGLWGRPGVITCNEDDALPEATRLLMEQAKDDNYRKKIRESASDFVVMDGPSYGERLADLAEQLVDCPK